MPHVHLLTTGGTIAHSEGSLVSGGGLLEHLGVQSDDVQWTFEEASRIPSSQMTPAMQVELARQIDNAAEQTRADTIVVSHGTDSLEESAFMADMLCSTNTPVVFTGAMRSGHGGDGPMNLRDAASAGLDATQAGLGTVVVMAGSIHAASEARKLHSSADDAFVSRDPLGSVDRGSVRWSGRTPLRVHMPMITPKEDVWIIRLGAGAGPAQIHAAQRSSPAGVILELLGKGNIPQDIHDAAVEIARNGCPVACTTRTGDGMVSLHNASDHLIPIGFLDALKARLVLMLGAASSMGPEELRSRLDAFGGS